MSTLSIRIPDSPHRAVRDLAEGDQVSINQFIAIALTGKVASPRTVDSLRQRASQAKLSDFDQLLLMVPDATDRNQK
jgi:HicB family